MKINKTIQISAHIIFIFIVAMLMSFIPELYRDFFGDWQCAGYGIINNSTYKYSGCTYGGNVHLATYHWGYRHWLFALMGFVLFIIQVVNIIIKVSDEK